MCSKASQDFLAKLKKFFDDADENRDGTLRPLELKLVFCRMGMQVEDKFIYDLFIEIDKDKDHAISFDELKVAVLKKDPKEIQRAELEDTFKKMDKDGSGRLSKDEVKQQCIAKGIKMSDQALEKLMKDADTDGDGSINTNEFLNAWSKQ